jgi:cell volume regulation protein A
MDALADFFPSLLVVAALLLAALAAAPLTERVGLPGPASFLAVGIVAGLAGIGPVEDLRALRLEEIGAVALYAILFQGGLSTGFAAWRAQARPIVLLGLPGTAATAAGVALAGRAIGLGWPLAVLIGVALSPTDPAAVYATLRGRAETAARTVLEGESGFNDPIGISLMAVTVAAISDSDASPGGGALRLLAELGIGLAGGLVGAAALLGLLRLTPGYQGPLRSVAVVLGAVVVGAGTASLHGSGFLAVYVAGLLLSDAWAAVDTRQHQLPEALAAAAEPLLFGMLGAAFAPIVAGGDIWRGIVLTLATVLVIRPLVAAACLGGSELTRPERVLVSWGGLKGAVPLLLAAFPALESLGESDRTEAIVLVATATSILVQGATLRRVAGRVPAAAASTAPAAEP